MTQNLLSEQCVLKVIQLWLPWHQL